MHIVVNQSRQCVTWSECAIAALHVLPCVCMLSFQIQADGRVSKLIRETAASVWRSFLCIQKWSRTSTRKEFAPVITWDALLESPRLNSSVGWNYDPCSENLNHPIITHLEVEGEIVELPASTDFPILSQNRWVSHLCQAVLNLFIEFFSVAVAAWGFTVISFHNCARIPVSPKGFSIPGASRCREKGRPHGILHPFSTGTDIQLTLISATKYFTQSHIKAFTAATFQEKISSDFNSCHRFQFSS